MDTDKIELKAVMNIAQVAEYLTGLAKGLKAGSVVVEQEGQCLTLPGADTVEVEVEARLKKDKAKFSVEISWRLALEKDETPDLKVGAAAEHKKDAPKAEAPKIIAKPEAKPTAEAPKVISKPEVKPTPTAAHTPQPAKPKV